MGIPLQIQHTACICNAGKQKLYIKFDGKVYGCEAFKYIQLHNPNDNNEDVQPNSIYENDIEWIYKNSPYLKVASEKIKKIFANPVKENCPIQEDLRDKRERE